MTSNLSSAIGDAATEEHSLKRMKFKWFRVVFQMKNVKQDYSRKKWHRFINYIYIFLIILLLTFFWGWLSHSLWLDKVQSSLEFCPSPGKLEAFPVYPQFSTWLLRCNTSVLTLQTVKNSQWRMDRKWKCVKIRQFLGAQEAEEKIDINT